MSRQTYVKVNFSQLQLTQFWNCLLGILKFLVEFCLTWSHKDSSTKKEIWSYDTESLELSFIKYYILSIKLAGSFKYLLYAQEIFPLHLSVYEGNIKGREVRFLEIPKRLLRMFWLWHSAQVMPCYPFKVNSKHTSLSCVD